MNVPLQPQHPDAMLIDALGGPSKLARKLGYARHNGVQRVQNWKSRGIPLLLRYQRPDIFGPPPSAETALQPAVTAPALSTFNEVAHEHA